jgi:hypothetical protein
LSREGLAQSILLSPTLFEIVCLLLKSFNKGIISKGHSFKGLELAHIIAQWAVVLIVSEPETMMFLLFPHALSNQVCRF